MAVGAALRVAGASGELWFDEIWTLQLVGERAPTPLHVFWSVQHDNVHPLYGLYAALLPDHPNTLIYRLPAILCGIRTIIVAGLIGRRGGATEALIAMILVAFSYPLVHYGSEARGYGPMMFFLLVAFWLIEEDLRSGETKRGPWIAVTLAAAVLSHPLAVLAALVLALWAVLHHFSEMGFSITVAYRILRHFLPTAIALTLTVLLWSAAFAANGYEFGAPFEPAGFTGRFLTHVGDMVKLMFGAPFVPASIALVVAAVSAAGAVVWLFAKADPRAPLYTLMLLGLLGGLFLAAVPSHAFGRYYLFALVFLVPLAAQGLAALWASGRAQRGAAVGLIWMFIAGSAWANGHFLAYGRGDARAVLAMIARQESDNSARAAVDHEFRFRTTFDHHAAQATPGFNIVPVPLEEASSNAPRWLVLHHAPNSRKGPPPRHETLGTAIYELKAVSPQWGFSGFTWYLYRLPSALHR